MSRAGGVVSPLCGSLANLGLIVRIRLLRNVGTFDSATAGATIAFSRLTVICAENGRGKTTLTAVLRSIATGDPLPISERRRFAGHPRTRTG